MANSLTAAELARNARPPRRSGGATSDSRSRSRGRRSRSSGRSGAPSPLVTIAGTKWILDGTPIERLAAMNEPYADRAGWTGRLNLSPADIETVLRRALEPTISRCSTSSAIAASTRSSRRWNGGAGGAVAALAPHRARRVSDTRIARAKRLGIVKVQNPSHFTNRDRCGPASAPSARSGAPVKSLVEAGVPLALGARAAESIPEHDVRGDASEQPARSADARTGGRRLHGGVGLCRVSGTREGPHRARHAGGHRRADPGHLHRGDGSAAGHAIGNDHDFNGRIVRNILP